MLTAEGCAGRLARARRMMQQRGWDVLVTVQPGTVNCIERVLVPNGHPVVLWMTRNDSVTGHRLQLGNYSGGTRTLRIVFPEAAD